MGKQVKTPRFYVDMVTFLHATGQLGWDSTSKGGAELLYMNCANPFLKLEESDDPQVMFILGSTDNNPIKSSFPINFCALLNHNLGSDSNDFSIIGKGGYADDLEIDLTESTTNVMNYYPNPYFNGTSIFTFSDENGINDYFNYFGLSYLANEFDDDINYTHQLGSFVVGKYFDCPNSPDLNLTMSRRFDGIKKQKTIGGKTLANIYYDGPTEWTMNDRYKGSYKYPPFELHYPDDSTEEEDGQFRPKSGLGRKGLRSWKLTFSYITESDMWIDNEVSNIFITGGSAAPGNNDNSMLSDNSFNFVWNCTLGGTLPFIFTDDKDSNEPDRYAICTFRENTFNVDQVAPGTYTVQVTIDELA